jgi:hypothetical protein
MSYFFSFSGDSPPGGFAFNTRLLVSSKMNMGLHYRLSFLPSNAWIICPTYQNGIGDTQWTRGGDTEIGMGGSVLLQDSHNVEAAYREMHEEMRMQLAPTNIPALMHRDTSVFDYRISSLQTVDNWRKPSHTSPNTKKKITVLIHGLFEECFQFLITHSSSPSCQDPDTSFQDDNIMGLTMIPVPLARSCLIELENRSRLPDGTRDTRFAEFDVETCTLLSLV